MAYPNAIVGWPYPPGVRVHPTPVYEMLAYFAVFAVLWSMRKRPHPGRHHLLVVPGARAGARASSSSSTASIRPSRSASAPRSGSACCSSPSARGACGRARHGAGAARAARRAGASMKPSLAPIALLLIVLGAVAGLQYLQTLSRTGYAAPDFTLPDLQRPAVSAVRLARQGRVPQPVGDVVPALPAWRCRAWRRCTASRASATSSCSRSPRTRAAPRGAPVRPRDRSSPSPCCSTPDATLSPRYGATGYPETFIIDRNGQVVNHTIGPAEWDSARDGGVLRAAACGARQPSVRAAERARVRGEPIVTAPVSR